MAVENKNEIKIVGYERLTPAINVAKKFVYKGRYSRPVLTYVALKANGEIHATDSHRLLILKEIHSYQEELLLNPKTLELVKGYKYPEVEHLAQSNNTKATFLLTKLYAQQILPAIKFFKTNKYENIKFVFSKDSIVISDNATEITLQGFEFNINQNEEMVNEITFTTEYLLDAFEAFIKFSTDESISVFYQGSLRPFILENKEMTMVVLPIRVRQ